MRPPFRSAMHSRAALSTADLNGWTHRVGVSGGILGKTTPTRTAIGLSSPVGGRREREDGELSPWRSNLPPRRAEGAPSAQGEGTRASRRGRPCNRNEPDSRGTRPSMTEGDNQSRPIQLVSGRR